MFVIFEAESTKLVRIMRNGYWQDAKYETESAAKAAYTRLSKAGKLPKVQHVILDYNEFRKIEKTETVINLMSGKPVVQSVNTPLCCDVSSETYWSM